MRSFAVIASFAVLAFSAVTSALPTATSALPSSTGVPDITSSTSELLDNLDAIDPSRVEQSVYHRDVGYASSVDAVVARDYEPPKGIPDVLVVLTGEVAPMCKDLAVKITADADVQVKLETALEVFAQIKVLLGAAVADIKVIVAGDIGSAFCFGGKVLELKVVAEILADLVIVVVSCLGIAVKVCATVDIKALLAIVVDISGLLGAIIGLCLHVNGGIVVVLVPLLQAVVQVVLDLKLTAVISVLRI